MPSPISLIEILVARDDDCLQAIARRALGERRHDVVGLVAVDGDDGNMERVQDLAHALERTVEILLQLLAQLFARRLVLRILLLAERDTAIVDPADVIQDGSSRRGAAENS